MRSSAEKMELGGEFGVNKGCLFFNVKISAFLYCGKEHQVIVRRKQVIAGSMSLNRQESMQYALKYIRGGSGHH